MRTLLLTCGLGLGILAGSWGTGARAWAAGDLEGRGFRARLPVAFRPSGSNDAGGYSERAYRRRLDEGELSLVATCTECNSLAEAKLEMEAGAALDAVAGLSELAGGEVQRDATRVEGAEDAYEVIVSGAKGSIRTVVARRGLQLVTLTLRAPAGAEPEANEAWDAARGSLQVEDAGSPLGALLIGAVVALVLLTLGLTLRQRALRRSGTLVFSTPRPMAAADVQAQEPPVADLPAGAPLMRVQGGSLSRADDGLPTFTPEAKACGVDPQEALRAPESVHPKPAAPRPPNLAPPVPRLARGAAAPPPSVPAAAPAATPTAPPTMSGPGVTAGKPRFFPSAAPTSGGPPSAPRTVPRADAPLGEPAAPPAGAEAAPAPAAPKRFTITRF